MKRLRMVSFVAERFWRLAFALRIGMEAMTSTSVRNVKLNEIEIDGVRKRGEVEFEVPEADAALALRIAFGVVVLLEDVGYRILNAIVPDTSSDGKSSEHDLVGERKGAGGQSSIEVKCKIVKSPKRLFDTFRRDMRTDALKLWNPAKHRERVVVLVEFTAEQTIDDGWRIIRCERYNGAGWQALRGWGGGYAGPLAPRMQPPPPRQPAPLQASPDGRRSVKRPRGVSNDSNSRCVLIAGTQYTTLDWYLGHKSLKSEWQLAVNSCASKRVELRNGDSKSLVAFFGAELLDEEQKANFKQHRWVNTLRSNRGTTLQVKLLKTEHAACAGRFLWCWGELEKCKALKT